MYSVELFRQQEIGDIFSVGRNDFYFSRYNKENRSSCSTILAPSAF